MLIRRIALFAATLAVISTAAVALVISGPSGSAYGQTINLGDGVRLKILSAAIPADLKPVVTFTLADSRGVPLKISDLDENSLRFTIAAIQPDPDIKGTKYVSYVVGDVQGRPYKSGEVTVPPALPSATQAMVDTGGVFADLGGGKFSYTFKTAAPGDYDASATHTVGGYATRAGRSSVSNDVFDFVPNGGAVQERREAVTIDACNACHDNLAAHGGTRRDTKLCVLCHTSQTKDPESGNTVDFKVLVHKIHEGANLPSVEAGSPYVILGFNLSRFDASDIRWPQDTRNCQTCHKGPQSDFFKTKPSAEACGSCHDNVNFTTGQNHAGGPQPNSACSTCHAPDGGEFDLSVTGAHTIPEKSKQLRGVNFEILSFTNTAPGQSPTVVFSIKDNAGNAIQPSEMASLALILAGPTTDYSTAVNETVTAANSTVGADGNVSYTFKVKIPDDAVGSWGVATQGYLTKQLKNFLGATVTSEGNPDIRDVGFNKVAYAAVTDPVAMPRKQVVDVGLCNKCHETLALHGGSRRNTEFCVFCHNPNGTDVAKRTTAGGPMPPESIVFSRLIHRVHTGEEQQDKPYIIYGGSPASPGPVNLSEARFPTDRKNCAKCHVPQSNLLPFIRPNMLPTTVKVGDDIAFQMGPIQTACMGCHDSQAARAHGDTMTASGNREACLVCHNEGRDQAVSQVHRYP